MAFINRARVTWNKKNSSVKVKMAKNILKQHEIKLMTTGVLGENANQTR